MTADLRKGVFKIFLLGLAALFALPLATWLFVRYAEPQRDADHLAAIERAIDQDPQLSAQQRDEQKAFFRANPPSSTILRCSMKHLAHCLDRRHPCRHPNSAIPKGALNSILKQAGLKGR